MIKSNSLRVIAWLAVTGTFFVLSGAASADPIVVNIDNASNYTLIHEGANPSGAGDRNDWWHFGDDQTLNLDLTAGILTLFGGIQSFDVSTNNGAMGIFDITGFVMDLNDADGFLAGILSYVLTDSTTPGAIPIIGAFVFDNANYGSSPFNSSSLVDSSFNLFVWGGDTNNHLGIDFGASAQVPEPGTLALFGIGLVGLGISRRRRKA